MFHCGGCLQPCGGLDLAWAPLLQSYVSDFGRGLLAVMDYQGFDIGPSGFAAMNDVVAPSGVSVNGVSLDWADAQATVAIDCVPNLPPPR